jgi:hypothetical protein
LYGNGQKHSCTLLLVLPPLEEHDIQLGGEPSSEPAEAGTPGKKEEL